MKLYEIKINVRKYVKRLIHRDYFYHTTIIMSQSYLSLFDLFSHLVDNVVLILYTRHITILEKESNDIFVAFDER